MSDSNDCHRQAKVPIKEIGDSILVLRRQRIILDADLAALYGVATKVLNQTVKRNVRRFPENFIFRLTRSETEALNRSQFVTGSQKHRDPRFTASPAVQPGPAASDLPPNPRCHRVRPLIWR